MSGRAWIQTSLQRRPVWLAACSVLICVALGLGALRFRDWRSRDADMERENMRLQLRLIAQTLAAQSDQLIDRGRELAESDAIARLVQEGADPAQDHLEPAELARRGVDSLLVLSGHSVRFSTEQPPNPELLRVAEAAPAGSATEFADDRWIVARPVLARASASPLGWVVLTRTMNPGVFAQLAGSIDGSLSLVPPREFKESSLPPETSHLSSAHAAGEPNVTMHLAADNSAGYLVLREPGGRATRAIRFTPQPRGGNFTNTIVVGALIALILAVLIALWVRRYFRHQRSVDARYKALIDQANDGIVIVDAHSHQVLYTNPAFLDRLGYTNEEAQALKLGDIFADGTATPESVVARLSTADSAMAMNMQQRCKSGLYFDTEVRCNMLDVDGRDVLAFVTHDVSLRRKAEQQLIENQQRLDKMAHHDQLTGLPNRHYLTAFLPQAIEEAKAASTMLGVVFLDLDRFKHINDTRGHETGDKLLQEVATRLRSCVRDTDVVIRMGGDEFVVVFRNVKHYDEVTLGAGRIVETLNRPMVIDRHPLQTTGSVGVSLYPRDGADMIELLKHSDTAMYQAKDRGRNNVQMFSHAMNRKLKHRVAVEASLREALRLKQLDVHYQPFVNLTTRKIVGLEALMRWSHPVHGMIPADQFIPVAEETGLIVPMGNFVLHRTLQTMSAWRKAGVPLVPVSLNVAPAQLQRGELQSTISTLLKSHNLRPEMLQLEMTERAVFDSQPHAGDTRQDTIARLRDLGIKIAIDDFGTGYSSLSYLKNWRVDALKIDRSFVRDLVTDSSDLAIVSAIIAIARHLHIEVIAEGIEAYQQVEILRRLGCSVGQGFLFARPMPSDEILKLLRDEAAPEKEEEEDMLAAVFSAGRG